MLVLRTLLSHLAKLFGSQRKLWVPFLLVAFVEALFLLAIWLAPQPPFSAYLAPPLRYFFSDRVLHYPAHLWFLYHAMKHTHLAALTLVGAYLTGIACVMVRQIHEGAACSLRDALVSKQVRYGRVVILWAVTWGLARGLSELVGQVNHPGAWIGWSLLAATIVLQSLLIYAIPAAVFNGSTWWRALGQGAGEALRYPVTTLLVVAIPSAFSIAFMLAANPATVGKLMLHTAPEIVVPLLAARLIVLTLVDALTTLAIAHLWWIHRAPQLAPAAATTASAAGGPSILRPSKGLIGVMPLLLCLLSSTGCSEAYNGERLFWKAQQLSAPILKDPTKATPEQFTKAEDSLRLVIDKAPGTVWAARAQAAIAGLLAIQKSFDQARAAYVLVLQNYGQFKDLVLNSRIAIAKTYEVEANWPEAVKAYNDLIEFHPWSPMGLQAPLYIALIHTKQQQPEQATRAYERAVRLYEKLIPDAPTPEAAAQVKGYLAQAHERLEHWDEAITVLNELLSATEGVNRPLTLLMLGSIYQTRKHDPQKAGEIYTTLVTEFPKHPMSKVAILQMQHLGIPVPAVDTSTAPDEAGDQTTKPSVPPTPTLNTTPATAPN